MPIYTSELIGSRRGNAGFDRSTEFEMVYLVKGSSDLNAVISDVDSVAPTTVVDPANGITLYRDQIFWETRGRLQDGTIPYDVRVSYVDPTRQDERRQIDVGEYKISFDTTGGQAKFLTSKETIATFVPAGVAAADFNYQQAINVSRDGEVQGVDVVVPTMKFTISYRQPNAVITNAYVKLLEELTGTVNNASFFARDAGEVLFLGASGSQGTNSDPQIDYNFLRSRNTSGQTIGSILNVAKRGHEVLWCVFEDTPNSKWMPKVPKAIKVERVYDYADLSALGIGA